MPATTDRPNAGGANPPCKVPDLRDLQARWDAEAAAREDAALIAAIDAGARVGWRLHAALVTALMFLLPVAVASGLLRLLP